MYVRRRHSQATIKHTNGHIVILAPSVFNMRGKQQISCPLSYSPFSSINQILTFTLITTTTPSTTLPTITPVQLKTHNSSWAHVQAKREPNTRSPSIGKNIPDKQYWSRWKRETALIKEDQICNDPNSYGQRS